MARSATSRSGPLRRWATLSTQRPWAVIGGWAAAFVVLALLTVTIGGALTDDFTVPGAESQQAYDTLAERFPAAAGDSAQVVFRADAGFTDPAAEAGITTFLTEAATLPEVMAVTSPYDAGTISPDGRIGYATVQYATPAIEVDPASVEALLDLVDDTATGTLQVEVGGPVVTEIPETGLAEIIGVGAAIIILLITFGSVVAMGLPVITALVGVGLSILLTLVLASFINFSTITTALLSMMGLGVGIDYALFIITRFREERANGRSVDDSVTIATDTAGRSVLFAGTIVVVALLGLFAIGIPFIGFLGAGGAIAVVMSMLIAVGLMPALLRLLGSRMDRWSFMPNRKRPDERTFGYQMTTRIQRAPWAWLAGGLIVIALLGGNAVFNAELGSADAGSNPADSTTRKAYDLIAEGFGPGANGPFLVVVETADGAPLDPAQLDALAGALSTTEGVQVVSPPTPNEGGDTAILQVIPLSAPQDAATQDLLDRLRDQVIPAATDGTALEVYIGGATATFADLATAVNEGLLLYIALVAGLSIIILMAVFRSVLIPIKAAIVNLMSFFAGYGALVLIFQEGFLGINDLIGVDRTGPIESFLPVFLFGILFGLSMDYEVFLISRVHEAWNRRPDNAWALAHGIGRSGRVVLAAGAIMTSVFLAFALGDARAIKEIGIGLGVAILIDVLVVRMIIVPAFMSLAGSANWWFPAWLDRILPRLDVEGEAEGHAGEHGGGTSTTGPASASRGLPTAT